MSLRTGNGDEVTVGMNAQRERENVRGKLRGRGKDGRLRRAVWLKECDAIVAVPSQKQVLYATRNVAGGELVQNIS
jgi:hypothetical protein